MKKNEVIRLRIDDKNRKLFREACDFCGMGHSAVMRDLCKAAVPYMTEHCTDGRWRPPVLITERQAATLGIKGDILTKNETDSHKAKTGK